jgi:hypothetical protein
MKKILFTLAAMCVLSIAFATPALAAPRSGQSSHSSGFSRVSSSSYRGTSYSRSNYSGRVITSSYRGVSRGSNYVSPSRYVNYHQNYGTRFAHGYFYSGRSHNHWSYSRYDSRYGCTCYYDPCCSCWYYWCEPVSCYYPVTYCPYQTYCWE